MILERTPILDDLLDAAIVRCELSVSKKKQDAVETLRLLRVRPARVHEEMRVEQRSRGLPGQTSMRGPTSQKTSQAQGIRRTKKKKKRHPQRKGLKGIKTQERLRRLEANKIPDPPDPPYRVSKLPEDDTDESLGSVEAVNMNGEMEERTLTQKLNTSQSSSTSVVSPFLPKSSENSMKKIGAGDMDKGSENQETEGCRNRPQLLLADSSQIGMAEIQTGKVHWEPPGGKSQHQE